MWKLWVWVPVYEVGVGDMTSTTEKYASHLCFKGKFLDEYKEWIITSYDI